MLQVQITCHSNNSFQTKVVTIPDISIQTSDSGMMKFKTSTVGFQISTSKQLRDKTDRIKEVDRDQHQTILEASRK